MFYKKKLLGIIFVIHVSNIFGNTIELSLFQHEWRRMQQDYIELCNKLEHYGWSQLEALYCHPTWKSYKEQIRAAILGPVNPQLFKLGAIHGTMIREGFTSAQEFEVDFLSNKISKDVLNSIKALNDEMITGSPVECSYFNCSTNTLGHLYYAGKMLDIALKNEALNGLKAVVSREIRQSQILLRSNELPTSPKASIGQVGVTPAIHPRDLSRGILATENNKKIERIIEFGAGFGNLARIFKLMDPNISIILIDLPEMIALQLLFLRLSFPNVPMYVHASGVNNLGRKGIHLVPVLYQKDIDVNADVFVSTFGLSEAPEFVQRQVSEKLFFNAHMVYLAGQYNGWQPVYNFETHAHIFKSIELAFDRHESNKFHLSSDFLNSYEIIGIKNEVLNGLKAVVSREIRQSQILLRSNELPTSPKASIGQVGGTPAVSAVALCVGAAIHPRDLSRGILATENKKGNI